MVATDGAFWLQHVDLQHSVEASSSARLKHQVNMSSASENGPDAVNRLSSSIVSCGPAAHMPGGLSMPVVCTEAVGKPAYQLRTGRRS